MPAPGLGVWRRAGAGVPGPDSTIRCFARQGRRPLGQTRPLTARRTYATDGVVGDVFAGVVGLCAYSWEASGEGIARRRHCRDTWFQPSRREPDAVGGRVAGGARRRHVLALDR